MTSLNVNQIDIERTALLFFDLIDGFYHQAEPVKKALLKPMIDNAVRLMNAGRKMKVPIFFAKGSHRADGLTASNLITDTDNALRPWPNGVVKRGLPVAIDGTDASEVIPELKPSPTDYYVPKQRWSAFHQTYLDLALRSRSLKTVIVAGASTEIGVAATIFAGRDLDYNLIVVRDACVSAYGNESRNILMNRVFPRMCRVRTTDEGIVMLSGRGQIPFEEAETTNAR